MITLVGLLAIAVACAVGGVFLYRRYRYKGVVAMVPLFLFAGPFLQQCAPAPTSYTGVGHISTYESGNAISGGVRASAAAANGYTQIRSRCKYFMNMPPGHTSYWQTTVGTWVNPPDANDNTIGFPEVTRVESRCEVPSVAWLPAGAYPTLIEVWYDLG